MAARRIWAVFGRYYPDFSGAAHQGTRNLQALAGLGYEPRILASANLSARSLSGQTVNRSGIPVTYVPVIYQRDWTIFSRIPMGYKFFKFANGLLLKLSMAARVARIIRSEGNPGDVLQLYSSDEFSYLVIRAAKARGMPAVIRMTLLGSDNPGSLQGGLRASFGLLRLRAFREADAVISLSSALTRSCLENGLPSHKVHQIPNGVDSEQFSPAAAEQRRQLAGRLGLNPEKRFIGFVGTALHRKGIDLLIRAFILVAGRFDGVDLLVIGPSDLEDRARHSEDRRGLVAQLKLELQSAHLDDRVCWTGRVENVHEYLQCMEIFCLPSRREGMSNAILEAMSVGLPIVASCLEGTNTDLIRPDVNGVLVAEENPPAYAAALISLLEDRRKALSLGQSARERVVADFSLSSVVRRYASVYNGVTGNRHA